MIHDKFFEIVKDAAKGYGCGYGECRIIETKEHIIFEFYNAGWSECEYEDMKLQRKVHPIVNDHPISVYVFKKAYLNKKVYDDLEMTKKNTYVYKIKR